MILKLESIFLEQGAQPLPFAYELDWSSVEINSCRPFCTPVKASGTVRREAGAVLLEMEALFRLRMPCDRCAEEFERDYRYSFRHRLARSLEEKDNDEYLTLDGYDLDVDELLRADILLELPTKYLCRPDCRGLCPVCGKNLNEGSCGCEKRQIDPRLEVLKQLID